MVIADRIRIHEIWTDGANGGGIVALELGGNRTDADRIGGRAVIPGDRVGAGSHGGDRTVDAMRAMGTIEPKADNQPSVLAGILMLPLLTPLNDLGGLRVGCVASGFSGAGTPCGIWTRASNALEFADVMQG